MPVYQTIVKADGLLPAKLAIIAFHLATHRKMLQCASVFCRESFRLVMIDLYPTYRCLCFEPQAEEAQGVCTFEAMASVRVADWQQLQHEVVAVLQALERHCRVPAMPLDEGGVWDAWLQVQNDEAVIDTLCPTPSALQNWRPAPETHWIAVTLTLVFESEAMDLAAILTNV